MNHGLHDERFKLFFLEMFLEQNPDIYAIKYSLSMKNFILIFKLIFL
jgi:hypothetical protein